MDEVRFCSGLMHKYEEIWKLALGRQMTENVLAPGKKHSGSDDF